MPNLSKPCVFLAVFICLSVTFAKAASSPNSWNSATTGFWQESNRWSLAVPPSTVNQTGIFITNAISKTVTINSSTPAANLTINDLTLAAPSGLVNTLQITNMSVAAPLRILNNFTINSGGALVMTNSSLRMEGSGKLAFVNGSATIRSGASLIATNTGTFTAVGNTGGGNLNLLGGNLLVSRLYMGVGSGSQGTLQSSGGTIMSSALMCAGCRAGSAGTIWIAGGQVTATNDFIELGADGLTGQMTLSNGTVTAQNFAVGAFAGSRGTLTVAGGTLKTTADFSCGFNAGPTGTVWITGGQLAVPTGGLFLGNSGVGRMTVSNGSVLANNAFIGNNSGSAGSLAMYGGEVSVWTRLFVGYCPFSVVGNVTVAGGTLYVTNAAGTAVLDLSSGTLTLNGGTLIVDKFVVTNTCARFVYTSGTLLYGTSQLSATLDADGDGLRNDWEVLYGLGPLNPFGDDGASGDPDGDGISNAQELALGTNPKDPNSPPFRITSVSQEGNNLRIRWTTLGSVTNFVQAASSPKGPYVDISPAFVIAAGAMSATNYLDIGVATGPSRYYRIRIGVGGTVPLLSAVIPNSGLDTATGLTLRITGNNFLSGATVMLKKTGQPDVVGGGVVLSGSTNLTALFNLSNTATGLWNVVVANPNAQPATLNNGFTVILDPVGDRDADGLPNGWETQFGFDPFSATGSNGAAGDPDGDAMSNLEEYLAGTNPTNPASLFRITAITRESNNIRVTWMMGPGKTNALERTAGAGGSFFNNFAAIFTITNTVGTTTNYLDLGAATNATPQYYRVRVVP